MTEKKRFVASVDESCIVDNLDNKGVYSVVDTVECLNNLHEENEQLKTFLESLREELSLADRDNTTLEKENEQLKKALVELKEIGDYQAMRIKELDEDFDDALNTISKIQEENQALQEEIKDYNDVLARLEEQNEQLKKENKILDDLWGEKCVREHMQFLGETALKEMHDEKYGDDRMTKRFTFEIKTQGNKAYTQWYDNRKPINSAESIVDLLNALHEENQSIKKHIGELYEYVKIHVDNEIEVYPKVLLEYIVNILKIIGDLE